MNADHDAPTRRSRYATALRALLWGSAGFWVSVVVCLAISHDATVEHDGISLFSVQSTTLPVILLGYGAVTTGMLIAARSLPDDQLGQGLALPLRAFPVLFVALLVTPFNHGAALNWTHMTVGVTLAIAQAAVTAWICTVVSSPMVFAAAAIELVGGMVAAVSMPDGPVDYLLQGELVFNVGFCLCLIAVVHEAAARSASGRDAGALRAWWVRD